MEYVQDGTHTWSGLEIPSGWHIVDTVRNYHNPEEQVGLMWERLYGERITVIEDITTKADGKRWLHVSTAKPNRKMPTYEDLQTMRRLFIGEDKECYMVFPSSDRYVNFGNVLHLWCCLDEPHGVLPHFEAVVKKGDQEMISI